MLARDPGSEMSKSKMGFLYDRVGSESDDAVRLSVDARP